MCRKYTELSVYGHYRSLYGYNGILAQFKVLAQVKVYTWPGQFLDNLLNCPDAKKSDADGNYTIPTRRKCAKYTEKSVYVWRSPYIYGSFCIYGFCRFSLSDESQEEEIFFKV